MSKVTGQLLCPSCSGHLAPRVLQCESCDIRVEGAFQWNEFATLSAEDLHFLRIFIHCEGRVRDMEPALGLSYPTIRNRIAALKEKLTASKTTDVDAILNSLEAGSLNFESAFEKIKLEGRK